MSARTIFLVIVEVVCFAAAYRFASHGIMLHDNLCIGLAVLAVAVGLILLLVLRNRRRTK